MQPRHINGIRYVVPCGVTMGHGTAIADYDRKDLAHAALRTFRRRSSESDGVPSRDSWSESVVPVFEIGCSSDEEPKVNELV